MSCWVTAVGGGIFVMTVKERMIHTVAIEEKNTNYFEFGSFNAWRL